MARKNKRSAGKACAIYARFSSERQRDESIEDQVAACESYARAHGLEVVATYADRAKSGTSDERPEFQRMVAESDGGGWATLLVYKLDRFARDRFDAALYRRRLRDNGVELVSAMESIPDTPEGSILESVIEGYNEYYSRNLSQNVRRGMEGNARRCMANGVSVYGYDIGEDGRYVINERQAADVRELFALAATRATRKEMLEWMERRGMRNTRGGAYNYNSLRALLSCEKYVGVYEFGGVRVEGGMPAIVGRELFDRVALSNRARPRVNSFPLSGALFDDETGMPYHGTSGTSSNGKSYLYYSCDLPGGVVRYPKEDVERTVGGVLRRVFREPGVAGAIADMALEAMAKGSRAAELREARDKLAVAERRRERLLDAIEAGAPAEAMAKRLADTAAEVDALRGKVDRLAAWAMPTRDWVVEWVCNELCREMTKQDVRRTMDSATIDENGKVRVKIPWLESLPLKTEKDCEHAGNRMFAAVTVGSPDKECIELGMSSTKLIVTSGQRVIACGGKQGQR